LHTFAANNKVSESCIYGIQCAPSRGIYVELANLEALADVLGVEVENLLKEKEA